MTGDLNFLIDTHALNFAGDIQYNQVYFFACQH